MTLCLHTKKGAAGRRISWLWQLPNVPYVPGSNAGAAICLLFRAMRSKKA